MSFRLFPKDEQLLPALAIAPAKEENKAAISSITKQAYRSIFGIGFNADDHNALFREFGQSHSLYFVAKKNNRVIGYAKLLLQQDQDGNDFVLLEKIYFSRRSRG